VKDQVAFFISLEVMMTTYRAKWERYYNRKIEKGWQIHHIDHNHENNEINNLLHIPKKLHLRYHMHYNYLVPELRWLQGFTGENIILRMINEAFSLRKISESVEKNYDLYSDMFSAIQLQDFMLKEKTHITQSTIPATIKYLSNKYNKGV
jgi:hypothetical protein